MVPVLVVGGVVVGAFLLLAAGNAEDIATRDEMWDAVGRRDDAAREVEPTDWKVAKTRYAYLLGALVAFGFAAVGVLL